MDSQEGTGRVYTQVPKTGRVFNAYLCFKVPEKPGLSLLTKQLMPTAISRSGWNPLSEITTRVVNSSIFAVLSSVDCGCETIELRLLMGSEEGEVVEVEVENFCFLDGGSMALREELGLAMLGEAT